MYICMYGVRGPHSEMCTESPSAMCTRLPFWNMYPAPLLRCVPGAPSEMCTPPPF